MADQETLQYRYREIPSFPSLLGMWLQVPWLAGWSSLSFWPDVKCLFLFYFSFYFPFSFRLNMEVLRSFPGIQKFLCLFAGLQTDDPFLSLLPLGLAKSLAVGSEGPSRPRGLTPAGICPCGHARRCVRLLKLILGHSPCWDIAQQLIPNNLAASSKGLAVAGRWQRPWVPDESINLFRNRTLETYFSGLSGPSQAAYVKEPRAELCPTEAFDERWDAAEINKARDSTNVTAVIALILFLTLHAPDWYTVMPHCKTAVRGLGRRAGVCSGLLQCCRLA